MNIFGTIAGSVKGMMTYNDKKEDNAKLKDMSHDELMHTANRLKNENISLKERLIALEKENGLLKQCVINDDNKNTSSLSLSSSSQFNKFVNSLKTTFLSIDDDNYDDDGNMKNVNDFKTFLYNQSLFYGGIEEEDSNYLNQFLNLNDNDWNNNKDVLLFKQTILERNYRELINNVLGSYEINKHMKGKVIKEKMTVKDMNKDKDEKFDLDKEFDNDDQYAHDYIDVSKKKKSFSKEKEQLPKKNDHIYFKENDNENKDKINQFTSNNSSSKDIKDKEIPQPQIAKAKTLEHSTTPIKKIEPMNQSKTIKTVINSNNSNNNKSNQKKKTEQHKEVLASLLFDNLQDDDED